MAESIKEVPQRIPVVRIDNPHAPEIFITDVPGFWLYQGNVHLTLEATRVNHNGDSGPVNNRVVVARVVMPVACAQKLAASLYDFLKTRGLDPVPKPIDIPLQ
jgi:hypothetical protein